MQVIPHFSFRCLQMFTNVIPSGGISGGFQRLKPLPSPLYSGLGIPPFKNVWIHPYLIFYLGVYKCFYTGYTSFFISVYVIINVLHRSLHPVAVSIPNMLL